MSHFEDQMLKLSDMMDIQNILSMEKKLFKSQTELPTTKIYALFQYFINYIHFLNTHQIFHYNNNLGGFMYS